MEDVTVKQVLQNQRGLEVAGQCIGRVLARVSTGNPGGLGEAVFVEVFDHGEDSPTGQRFSCWVFTCAGFSLVAGAPAATVEEAVEYVDWDRVRASLGVGLGR